VSPSGGVGRRRIAGALAVAALSLSGCSSAPPATTGQAGDHEFGHVHGLGIDPADNGLYVASHMGVFKQSGEGFERIADRWQDTMAFTVVGPDHFLASGHPDMREDKPVHLGLIESTDAAKTWESLSLEGRADFHALEPAGERLYGYDSQTQTLMVTSDRREWQDLTQLPVVDLAADPNDADSLMITDTSGRLMRMQAGLQPQLVPDAPRLVFIDWPEGDLLVGLAPDGSVFRSIDGGATWQELRPIEGPPEALAVTTDRWYAATEESIYVSEDEGSTWSTVDGTH